MKYLRFAPHFIVKEGIHGVGVFVTVDVKKGRILFKLKGPVLSFPTRTSVQVGKDKHIEDEIGSHINHSCSPNARVDRWMRAFITIRDIKKGEEITFDYNENEDRLASPFKCECCQNRILGKTLTERASTTE